MGFDDPINALDSFLRKNPDIDSTTSIEMIWAFPSDSILRNLSSILFNHLWVLGRFLLNGVKNDIKIISDNFFVKTRSRLFVIEIDLVHSMLDVGKVGEFSSEDSVLSSEVHGQFGYKYYFISFEVNDF